MSKKKRNPYEILGLPNGASETEIKAAFRALSKDCHPDRFPDDKLKEARFKEINAAYTFLTKGGDSDEFTAPAGSIFDFIFQEQKRAADQAAAAKAATERQPEPEAGKPKENLPSTDTSGFSSRLEDAFERFMEIVDDMKPTAAAIRDNGAAIFAAAFDKLRSGEAVEGVRQRAADVAGALASEETEAAARAVLGGVDKRLRDAGVTPGLAGLDNALPAALSGLARKIHTALDGKGKGPKPGL